MTSTDRATRLVDVAEAAGVSIATASRALSGTAGVSARVAEHVRDVAEGLGYVPNAHARALAGGAAPIVGLIVHDVADPYFAELSRGVLRVASDHGLMVLIHQSERSPSIEAARIRSLRANRVGSIVLTGSGYTEAAAERDGAAELLAFRDAGGRVALVGRHHVPLDTVLPDNRAGGATAVGHLVGRGHRIVAVVAGPPTLTTVEDRVEGARDAWAAAGRAPGDLVVEHDDFSRAGGAEAARRVLARRPDVTAVFAITDLMALGVLATLREQGMSVPAEMSVVGFDDVPVAADLAPALTTVRLPLEELGASALELALRPPAARPRRKRTGHALVVRASTGPPRPRG